MSPTLSPEMQETPVVNAENPWPGLAPFDEAQAPYFFGREREVEDLFRRVRLNLLSVLYGQSGLGKTSLVRAALFPKLRGNAMLPVPIRLDYADDSAPARSQIWQAFAAAMQQAGQPAPVLAEDQTLWEYFHHRALALSLVPVLVFDQFEELFTLGPERRGGAGFVRDALGELAALIENRPPDRVEARFDREPKLVAQYDFDRRDYRMLVSLREDYLAHLHDLSGKIPSITLNNMRLTPLDGTRALEAVERPGGKLVAPGAAEAIVRVVAGAREERAGGRVGALGITDEHERHVEATPLDALTVDPSLLSLLCRELNQKRRDERQPAITPELVEKNRENILNNFYERCLAGLPEGVQVFVEEDLLTETGFRETLNVDNAESKLRQHGSDPRALTVLVNRRLLHYEQRGASTRVELTHDVLAPVVRQSRTLRREREAVREAEARRRRELEESERAAQAARAEAEAKLKRSRRQRRISAAIGVVLAAVAAVAIYSGIQARQQRKEALHQKAKADSLVTQLQATNTQLTRQDSVLRQATAAATAASDTAHTMLATAQREHARSDTLVGDFCKYGLTVINRFGDSTSGNQALARAYRALIQISDASVEKMLDRGAPGAPAERLPPTQSVVCPRQLDARIESISSNLAVQLNDTAEAKQRGHRAILAARELAHYQDSTSRQVLNATYYSIVASLHAAGDDSSALVAAREGLPYAGAVNPARDSNAYFRNAWMYDFGALALIGLGRGKEAKSWADSGLAVLERGLRRNDQDRQLLLYSQSYLELRRASIAMDSTARDSAGAIRAIRAATHSALARHQLLNPPTRATPWVVPLQELGTMQYWHAEYASQLGLYAEALAAVDSSEAHWAAALRITRSNADTTGMETSLKGVVRALRSKSFVHLAQKNLAGAAAFAQLARDSARALIQLRSSADNESFYVVNVHTLGHRYEDAGQLSAADSTFRTAVRLDSAMIVNRRGPEGPVASDMEDVIRDDDRVIGKRIAADTAGQTHERQVALMRAGEERRRPLRETQVWLRRRSLDRLRDQSARDSLAISLSNLSWTDLLTDRPEQAADAARESASINPQETWELPNWFNAVLLSGNDEQAAALFRQNVTRLVEDPKVPFPCAVLRDIRELARRGIATERHVGVVEGLVAAQQTQCQNPSSSPTR